MADENDEKLKWTELSCTELLETPVFTVTKRHSRSSDGLEGDYIVTTCRDWVFTIPEIDDDFLMVKQWRHGEKALSIEFPGGVNEWGEDPAVGAARELEEETGYRAGKLEKIGVLNPNPAINSNHIHIFVAKELVKVGDQKLDHDEYVNCFRMKKSEVLKKMGTPEFQHALMVSAIGLYLSR